VIPHLGLPQRLLLTVAAKEEVGASGRTMPSKRAPLQLYWSGAHATQQISPESTPTPSCHSQSLSLLTMAVVHPMELKVEDKLWESTSCGG
jgi:hypothetical protein